MGIFSNEIEYVHGAAKLDCIRLIVNYQTAKETTAFCEIKGTNEGKKRTHASPNWLLLELVLVLFAVTENRNEMFVY